MAKLESEVCDWAAVDPDVSNRLLLAMRTHPATPFEVRPLTWFDASGRDIRACLGDSQDVLANWSLLGVIESGGTRLAVLLERSELAVAVIEGDGVHFGVARAPRDDEAAEVERIFAVRGA